MVTIPTVFKFGITGPIIYTPWSVTPVCMTYSNILKGKEPDFTYCFTWPVLNTLHLILIAMQKAGILPT